MDANEEPTPSESVRRDCLKPLGLSVTEAAKYLGVSRKPLSDVANGRSGILPEMSIRLDKAFGGGADAWYRLQAAYDLPQAMKRADRIRVERLSTVAWRRLAGPCLECDQRALTRSPSFGHFSSVVASFISSTPRQSSNRLARFSVCISAVFGLRCPRF